MTTQTFTQAPIGSGFGHDTTAAEVLAGHDLAGTDVLVTGGYSGIGLATTRALVAAGARVIVPARRPDAARTALRDVPGVTIAPMDLADLDSVAVFADDLVASGATLSRAILSAAIMACPETRVGPGWEAQLATNHLGHFALINRLAPALAEGSRVVSVSSGAHHNSSMRWDDPFFTATPYEKWTAYGQAKTANALFARHLAVVGADRGVTAFSAHPGQILTPLQRHLASQELVAIGWIDEEGRPVNPSLKTPEQGAATQVWAAFEPRLGGLGGQYCVDSDVAALWHEDADGGGSVRPYAVDPAEAERLWEWSVRLTGLDGFRS